MPATHPGRHRAHRPHGAATLLHGTALLAASGGLVASLSVGAAAAPAGAPAPTSPVTPPVARAAATTVPVLTHTTISSTLRWGSRGSDVEVVQRIVGTEADGIFGPKTHAAVQRWQSRHGLVADGIVGPITTRAMGLDGRSQTSASRSGSTSTRNAVLAAAARYTGVGYSYGGSSPSAGFDCSGYTQYVFSQAGVSLPRTAEAQRQLATPVSQPQPGDLVFWGAPAWHVAIYAGDGMVYDSGRSGLSSQKRPMFSGVTGYGRVG